MNWENTYKTLEEYGAAVRNAYQDRLIEGDKIASGTLLNSCEFHINTGDTEISVELNLASYWKYVEYGRKPGKFPPPQAILDWIKIKPVIPEERNGHLPTEKQLAYLIGRKIATEGIEPEYMLRDTLEHINAEYEVKIIEALKADIVEDAKLVLLEFIKR